MQPSCTKEHPHHYIYTPSETVLFEHLIYSTAIAIIAGMIWFKRTGRDPSWIIIASAYAPDFDIVAGELLKKLDLNILTNGSPIVHCDFHNIAFLLLFATGGVGAEVGGHEVLGFVPVRRDWGGGA